MLLFMDGMAHYSTAEIARKYTAVNPASCNWAITGEGRFGNCVKRVSTNNGNGSGYVSVAPLMTRQGVWTPTTSGVCGFAVKVDDLDQINSGSIIYSGTNEGIFVVIEGSDRHVSVRVNPDGTFSLYRNEVGGLGSAVLLAQSVEGLSSAAWHYVEFKWVIHDTAGSFEIRLNGVTVLSYTGRTRENYDPFTSLGIWNAVRLLGMQSEPAPLLTVRMCDLYLADLTAPDPDDVHDFLGDGIVATIFPNGVGDATAWTPAPAGPNWDNVNDQPAPDDDATVVTASAPGAQDLYQFQDIPVGARVLGAHYNALVRKADEGSASVQPLVRQGGTTFLGPVQGVPNVTFDRYLTQPYDINPATGAPWTDAEINAGQFGLLKTS